MGFSRRQMTALKRNLDTKVVRSREAHGREFSYLEGWYVISEANRIFGFDGWSRETLESRCVLTRENRGTFLAVYIARVRITVHSGGAAVIREGHGSGERRGESPGEVHDIALKAAETDATKRALATFGKPFGLELYRSDKPAAAVVAEPVSAQARAPAPLQAPSSAPLPALPHQNGAQPRSGLHPDNTTPIPRPSRYYGRRQTASVTDQLRQATERIERPGHQRPSADQQPPVKAPPLAPMAPALLPGRIDKSVLAIPEPKRLRDRAHLNFVASQPCLVCGRQPSDPHHLRYAQPRAIGMKVSDEFTVPLCRGHHRALHQVGNEAAWWDDLDINALEIARGLWEETHPQLAPVNQAPPTIPRNASQAHSASGETSIKGVTAAEVFPVTEPPPQR
jgi:hypothetical protein